MNFAWTCDEILACNIIQRCERRRDSVIAQEVELAQFDAR